MNMKKLMAIIILLFVILFLGMGFLLYLQLKPEPNEPPKDYDGNVKKEIFVFHDGQPFITNLKDSNSYLKVDLAIEVGNKKDMEVLNKNLHRVRDKIISILRNVSEQDMKRNDIQDVLKKQIRQELQDILKVDTITGIYFNEFVMQ